MKEEKNILRILTETKQAIKEDNSGKLRKLSDQTNNTASRNQDSENIAIAVIIYALSKILERKEYKKQAGWKRFYNNVLVYLDKSINKLENKKYTEFRDSIETIRREIDNLSGTLKKHVKDIFRKASINKAAKIYEHGISLERTAKLLGITTWELQGYSGQKPLREEFEGKMNVRDRIKLVEKFFE